MLDKVLATLDGRKDQSVAALKQLLSIPSVSTKPEHKEDCRRTAQWLADQLSRAGMLAHVMDTPGHPVVLAKNQHQPGRPSVLFYGHYDVQPPEPLDLWKSPPFVPEVRDGKLFARGASDDKGPVWAHCEAVMAWRVHGGLPVNLTMLIEGEEESGSANLEAFVKQHAAELRADVGVVSDTGSFARGVPAITYGLRGLCYQEVIVTGTNADLHSGMFGGAVPNAANVLSRLIGSLHDEEGRITIEDFYDDVRALTEQEQRQWQTLPFDEKQFAADLGIPHTSGERGFSPIERRWARPTCDVNGLTSGYQGPGAKTVIPSKASAKISMRLVPDQDPLDIREKFRRTMRSRLSSNCTIEFLDHGMLEPALLPIDKPEMKLAAEAMEIGFGKSPVFIREGGSIPVGSLFKRELGLDTIFVGFGLPDDNLHAPNEKFDLEMFHAGCRTAAALYAKLSELRS